MRRRRELSVTFEEFGSVMQKEPEEAFQIKDVMETNIGFVTLIL